MDKSGKRKKECFPGDEGAGSKDLNPNELIILDTSEYLVTNDQSITNVTLTVNPRKTDTLSGQLLVLAPNGENSTEYIITDTIPLTDIPAGNTIIDLGTPGTAVGLYLTGGSVQVGISLEVNNYLYVRND